VSGALKSIRRAKIGQNEFLAMIGPNVAQIKNPALNSARLKMIPVICNFTNFGYF